MNQRHKDRLNRYGEVAKGLAGAGLMLLFAISLLSCEKDNNWVNPGDDDEEVPVKAPWFNLKSLGGDSISLSDLENKVVVLFFFGHSCSPCRTAAVNLETRLHKPYELREDYALLGIEASNGNTAAVNSFKSLTGVTFPILMNASFMANAYETTIDRLIVLNRSGYIHHKSNLAAGCDLNTVVEKVGMLLQN